MTEAELREELQDKTLADIAEEQGKTAAGLVQQLVATQTKRIDEAVADGKLSEEQAAELKADLAERMEALVEGEFRGRGDERHPSVLAGVGIATSATSLRRTTRLEGDRSCQHRGQASSLAPIHARGSLTRSRGIPVRGGTSFEGLHPSNASIQGEWGEGKGAARSSLGRARGITDPHRSGNCPSPSFPADQEPAGADS